MVSTERTSPTPRLPNTSITPNKVQVGGRLSRFTSAEKKYSWAYNVVKRGIKWRWSFRQPRLRFLRGQPPRPVFLEYVESMLKSGAIVKTDERISTSIIFAVERKDSKKVRVILDVKHLNKYIHCPKFRMISLKSIREILPKNSWLASIDLKEAYYHVPIHSSFQRYLAFRIGKQAYKFKALLLV